MKKGWWLLELKGYREKNELATYYLFDYDNLPAIKQELKDDFEWLKEEPEYSCSIGDEGPGESKINFDKFREIQQQVEVELPKAFLYFIETESLQYKIRSCTDCYLDLADRAVKVKGEQEGFIIHFLSDSQWCLHWYLYIGKAGGHFIVVSSNAYGFNIDDDEDFSASYNKTEISFEEEDIWFCSFTFTEFIYRFWIENEIWFSLSLDNVPLTPLQQDYVNHYLSK